MNTGISNTNSLNAKYMAPRPEGMKPTCVVITYSACNGDLNETVATLQKNGTSVHYIVDADGTQYQYHNDLRDKAFYAGNSSWNGKTGVNDFGIGVMLVNDTKSEFLEEQITQLQNFLTDVSVRYPEMDLKKNLVGLGEVTVNREKNAHVAPGPKFPWEKLATAGFGRYFNTTQAQKSKILLSPDSAGEDVSTLQEGLKEYGYGVVSTSIFDTFTQQATRVFNERYGTGLVGEDPPVSWTEASEYVLSQLLGQTEGAEISS